MRLRRRRGSASPRSTVRYWAGARAPPGSTAHGPGGATVADVLAAVARCGPRRLAPVLAGRSRPARRAAARARRRPADRGPMLEVLPPFAGG